jgi:hypothetical protein
LPAVDAKLSETLKILEGFDGLPSLKKLQAHLNLDSENEPISRKGWKEVSRGMLSADPVITGSIGAIPGLFGPEQSFKIIYCCLASKDLRRIDERAVVTELLPKYPYALFVFSDAVRRRFHFLNVKDEPQGKKRRLFRRIAAGNGERLRTAAERLGQLEGEVLKNLPLSQIQDRFDEAFDVERVTQDFFRVFATVYDRIAEEFAQIRGFEAEAGQLSQLLLDRLLFLYFIQKKGWLNGEPDYLYKRFKSHHHSSENSSSFYNEVLQPLFRVLSDPEGNDLECPAFFVPVEMRQTGTRGAIYGTREEAYGGADCEASTSSRGWGGEWEDVAASLQGSGDRGADVLPLAEGVWGFAGRSGASAEGSGA